MCVIAIKNKGVAMPNAKALKAMWDANDDGAGFMYTLDNKVFIEKGFMHLHNLEKSLKALSMRVSKKNIDMKDIPMVFHFRITTHGGTSPQNTHPFPVSPKADHLKSLEVSTELAVAHNGIISGMSDTDTTMSDTMIYITDILSPLATLNKRFYENNGGKTILENTIGGSKLAFLDKKGAITTIGAFSKGTKNDTKDLMFSNLNHEFSYRGTKSYYTYRPNDNDTYKDTSYYGDYSYEVNLKKLPVGVALVGKDNKIITYVNAQTSDIYYVGDDDAIYTKTLVFGRPTYRISYYYTGFATLSNSGADKGKWVMSEYDELDAESVKGDTTY